jgi:hypothetical protein
MCILDLLFPQANRNFSVPYCIVICGLSGCTIFFYIISQMARFSFKTSIECKACFVSTTFSETFFILRRIQRDNYIIINVHRSSYKVHVVFVRYEWSLNFLDICREILKYKISRKTVQLEPSCFLRTDIRKPVVAFRTSAKEPKNEWKGQEITEIWGVFPGFYRENGSTILPL